MKRILLILILGAAFGAAAAFLSATIFNNIEVNSERPNNHWYDCFIVLMAPGGALKDMLCGKSDGWTGPVGDSIQGSDLKEAMLFNALAWPVVLLVLAFLLSVIQMVCRWIFSSRFFSHAR